MNATATTYPFTVKLWNVEQSGYVTLTVEAEWLGQAFGIAKAQYGLGGGITADFLPGIEYPESAKRP